MLIRAALVAISVVAAHLALASWHPGASPAARIEFARFPHQIGEWTSDKAERLDDRTVSALNADDYLNRVYRRQSEPPLGLYVGYYKEQRHAATFHSPLNCLPGSGWEIVAHEMVPVGRTQAVSINRVRVRNEVSQLFVFYWYQSHGRVLASEYWSKWFLVFDTVRQHRSDGAIVRIVAPLLEWDPYAETAAHRRAVSFVQDLLPLLDAYVPA